MCSAEDFVDIITNRYDGLENGIDIRFCFQAENMSAYNKDKDDDFLIQVVSLMKKFKYGKLDSASLNHYNPLPAWNEAYKCGGHFLYQAKQKLNSESKEEKDNLELQKLRTEVMLITNQLADYEKLKDRSIRSERIAVFSVLVTVVGLVLQWVLNK